MDIVRSCYIHIPFCKTICSYCDFCKRFYHPKQVSTYLEALKKEIATFYQGETLRTLYIGGGTPSCLDIQELDTLFSILKTFHLANDVEVTFECNVEDITEILLVKLKENRVNRLSIGIETTSPRLLEKMMRHYDETVIKEKVLLAKQYFPNISIDLMYALPYETEEEFQKDLSFVRALNVPHISLYSLILEEHTKFFLDHVSLCEEETEAKWYQVICETLKKDGYSHYEISNFAKPGYESHHNLCYWKNEHYYGFGLGAAGYLSHTRYQNTRSLVSYGQGNYRKSCETLSKDDTMVYEMILGLRTKEGVSKQAFLEKYQEAVEDVFSYQKMVDLGVLEDGEFLRIKEHAWYLSNEVLTCFLERK